MSVQQQQLVAEATVAVAFQQTNPVLMLQAAGAFKLLDQAVAKVRPSSDCERSPHGGLLRTDFRPAYSVSVVLFVQHWHGCRKACVVVCRVVVGPTCAWSMPALLCLLHGAFRCADPCKACLWCA